MCKKIEFNLIFVSNMVITFFHFFLDTLYIHLIIYQLFQYYISSTNKLIHILLEPCSLLAPERTFILKPTEDDKTRLSTKTINPTPAGGVV